VTPEKTEEVYTWLFPEEFELFSRSSEILAAWVERIDLATLQSAVAI